MLTISLLTLCTVIKQRMQVHGSIYKSIFQCTKSVYKAEGLRAFYVSYPTTIGMTIPTTAVQVATYGSIMQFLNPTRQHNPWIHMVSGGLAGGFAAALTTPLDVIKTLLQTRGTAKDLELRNAGGILEAASIIKRQNGYAGFFRGLRPRIITAVPSTAICWFVPQLISVLMYASAMLTFAGLPTNLLRIITFASTMKTDKPQGIYLRVRKNPGREPKTTKIPQNSPSVAHSLQTPI